MIFVAARPRRLMRFEAMPHPARRGSPQPATATRVEPGAGDEAPRQVLLWRVVPLALALSATGCGLLDWQQRNLIFRPTAEIAGTPEDFNLAYEELWIPVTKITPAGDVEERIHGWWIPGPDPAAPVLLYLHGNGWNIGDSAYNTARLQRIGFTVLAIDYRGFGRSGGEFPSEAQVYEDARAAWQYLKRVQPDGRRRFIYGHSLGGAVAIELAVHDPDAAGLIVEGSFTSVAEMAGRSPWLGLLPLNLVLTQRFDSLSKVGRLRTPVLFIHGTADDVVPYEMSQRLYDAAPEPKRLVLVPGAGHSSIAVVGLAQYRQALRDFVRSVGLQF
jgi:hypothetical protein